MSVPCNTSSGTQALALNTEYSVANAATFNSGTPKTSKGAVTVWLDFRSAVASGAGPVAGDVITIRVYRSIGGGTLVSDDPATAPIGTIWTRDVGLVGSNWDVTVTLVTNPGGAGRAIGYEVNQNIGDVNTASITDAVITAAKFATDAIGASALAAAAVTKIQTGLALATDVTTIVGKLPSALIGGRMSSDVGSWLGTGAATPTVAGIPKVEDATTQARVTSTRAGLLDNLSLLDVASSALATSTLVTAVGSAVTAVGSAVANVQSRLPAALSGGNMPAAVQSIAANAITAAATAGDLLVAVAGQITGTVIGTAKDFNDNPITVTMLGVCKLLLAQAAGKLSGITGLTAGAPLWRDPSDTKDVIRGVVTSSGRTAQVDPT